ncbi:MAG TPA: hypothetical protein VEF89_14675 [Solirubrobacteraceae bacterium]|nr:hypothetical protein [Solirubrobacteraceae bacterium]
MIELRDAGPNSWKLSALATTWSAPGEGRAYFVNDPRRGMFLEQGRRGAFADAVSGREPVELRREHDPDGHVFASTTGGTMKFADSSEGLVLGAALSKRDSTTRAMVQEIRAKVLTGSPSG